jgi:outer membrane protein OmpA-like peptidoglycan-associated protein
VKKVLAITAFGGLIGCAPMWGMSPPEPATPGTPVFFQPFSAALDQSALATIASAAKAAEAQPNATVYVTGAADPVGSALANKYLSETRAQVVADQLVADGVAAERVHTRAIGIASAPMDEGSGAAQVSRRALIQVGD